VRGGDGALYHKYYDGGWSDYEDLGGFIAAGTGPAAVSWGLGRIDVFVQGGDGGLYHKYFTNGAWVDWEKLGNTVLGSGPAVCSWSSGRLDVFARSTSGTLIHRWFDGGWHDWEDLGGIIQPESHPSAAAPEPETLDVFFRGTDSKMYWKHFHRYPLSSQDWDPIQSAGGILTSSPGATASAGTVWAFVRATTGELYQFPLYVGWQGVGGTIFVGDPAAVSWGRDRIDVFVQGSDSVLWHRWWDGKSWKP
jgi:hypothetical protein